jgi:acetyl-CoA acetyltransferase
MREALIVSTARTPLTKAHRGEFNITSGPTLAAFAVRAAVERSKLDPALIEDAILGCGYPEGTTGRNVARQTIVRAGLPISIAGTTVNRFCASGLQAIAIAAGRIVGEGAPAMIAGGVESISRIRTREDGESGMDPWIVEHKPALYLSMIETADIVAARYGISREAQDRFSAESQRKTEQAQIAGRYRDEIIACTATMAVTDARRDGHRPGVRRAQAARAKWLEGGRHRPVGTQRSVRFAGHLLPAAARHSRGEIEREWRRDLDRPPVRHDRRAARGTCANRRPATRREVRGGDNVHRRRHGRGRTV